MSFSSDTKNELSRHETDRKCCQLAEIAGFLRVSGSLRLAGGGKFRIVISTENAAAARHYKRLIRDYFQVETDLEVGEARSLKKGHEYILTIGPEMRSDSILRETGILLVREGNNYISDGIYDDLIRKKCCRKSYLRGAFLGAGSVADPDKSYHLEFVVDSEVLANDLRKLIRTFDDLSAAVTERKGKYVVYMKNSQYISDTLALMGASHQMLKMEDVRIRKDLMNRTMRIMNCDTANTDRTVNASEKQIMAIRTLRETGEFKKLSAKLQALAELREAHPEASLAQLGEMADPPLKKSAVNGRMKRILKAAEDVSDSVHEEKL